jgi:hypothetical protein
MKDTVLVKLKSTQRISSNHFADVVMDSEGNSYIACFFMKADQNDYILILKVNLQGIVEWELGTESKGRATSITLGPKDQIFVTGFFLNDLKIGNKVVKSEGDKIFIAEISPGGVCEKIIVNEGSAMAFDICVNKNGSMLLGGVMENRVSFGEKTLEKKGMGQLGFLALFDPHGACEWIREFNAGISRIKTQGNDFFVTGDFNGRLFFGKDTLTTTHMYDNDGFLLSVDPDRNSSWLRQFGAEGVVKYGYRTHEKGNDIAFDKSGNIIVSAYTNKAKIFEELDCVVLTYSNEGNLLGESTVFHAVNPGIATFTHDDENNFWLSGSSHSSIFFDDWQIPVADPPGSFILKLNPEFEMIDLIVPTHKINMGFRSSCQKNNRIVFSGHFHEMLSIGEDTITSPAKHELFLYAFSIKKN